MKKTIILTICLCLTACTPPKDTSEIPLEASSEVQITKGATCEDHEKGVDYFVSGEVKVCNFEMAEEPGGSPVGCALHNDQCGSDPHTLFEKHCEGNKYKVKKHNCPHGCKKGACIHAEDQNQTVEVSKEDLPPLPPKGKLKATDCQPEQRNVGACIEIYQPVCGQVQVQCFAAPCDPIKETYANSCKACNNPNVISYTDGACFEDGEIKR